MSPWSMVVTLALVAAVGRVLIKLLDLEHRRQAAAVVVQAHLSDALLRQPELVSMRVIPIAHVPLLRGAPVTVELVGEAPSEELRNAVVRFVEAETRGLPADVRVHCRLAVVRPAPEPVG
jgi:hypothetical protein